MPSDSAPPTAPPNQDAAAIPYQRCDARHSPPGTPGSAGTPSGRRDDSSRETAAAPAAAASAHAMKARPPQPSSDPAA
ncbi:hypothetical protein [Actinomadura latina]|uniref:hypothetical protein n=1 Tax=Actinomadura latina TaxID=163603 RepID=UPI0008345DBA|nr:hypothetical protein [Actinomadura latina]